MPKFSIKMDIPGREAHEIFDRVSVEIEKLLGKLSLGKFEIIRNPEKKQLGFKAPMASATLTCREHSIQLDCQLGLLAAPFKGKIEEEVRKWVNQAFPKK